MNEILIISLTIPCCGVQNMIENSNFRLRNVKKMCAVVGNPSITVTGFT